MAEELDDNQNSQESLEQKNDKISKKYAAVMKIITSVVGGEQNLKLDAKLGGNTVAGIVAELFKDENEASEKAAKEGLKELLKMHVTSLRELTRLKKELEQKEMNNKKLFTEAANKWLHGIEQGQVTNLLYATTLEGTFKEEEVDRAVTTKPVE